MVDWEKTWFRMKFGLNKKLAVAIVLVVSVSILLSVSHIQKMLYPTELSLLTRGLHKDVLPDAVITDRVLLKSNNDAEVEYEVTGEIKDWVSLEGPEEIEKDEVAKLVLTITTPKSLVQKTYSGNVVIRSGDITEKVSVSLTPGSPVEEDSESEKKGSILHAYTIFCETCKETAPLLVELAERNGLTLKMWTDDEKGGRFDDTLEEFIVGSYSLKDMTLLEDTVSSLAEEGAPEYASDYIMNNMPTSYTCVCDLKGMCNCFEGLGDADERVLATELYLKDMGSIGS